LRSSILCIVACGAIVLGFPGCSPVSLKTPAPSLSPDLTRVEFYDVVILGGRVMDPESALDAVRNVGIRNGTIRVITTDDIGGSTSLDARGLVVAPGFIDLNQLSHSPEAQRAKVLDGVTAAFAMMEGAGDVDEWYAEQEGVSLIHFGAAIGHLPVRRAVLAGPTVHDAYEEGAAWPATAAEIVRIRQGVEHGLARGALGVGLDLGYDELGTSPWEVVEVFRAAAAFPGAPVHVALRKTRDHWLETGEVFLAALASGAPLHITGMGNFFGSDAPRLFELIGAARARGLDITTEAYPYIAGAAPVASANYADWETWPDDAFGQFSLPGTGEILTRDSFGGYRAAGGLVVVALNTEENLRWVLASSPAMIVSFGELRDGAAHPRLAGTYARVLGRYVREERALTLMDALRRITLLPAQRLEARAPALRKKGRIRVGADADITIFDPATVLDRATYTEPLLPSAGIRFVLVSGVLVVNEGVLDDNVAPGRAIRAPIQDPAATTNPVAMDMGAIATSVARRSARVQPGELVWIEGGADDVAFMERLAVAVGAEGGHPIVTIYSDEMIRRWYQEVPAHFDTQRDEWLWHLYDKADVIIRLQATNYGVYAALDPERLAARDAADVGASAPLRTRGVRAVWVGNGLHPSDWRARMLGVDRGDLEQVFARGLMTDPAGLAATGERLREILRTATTVRVQHPNGTDITVGTGRGNVVVTDGTTRLPPRPVGDGEQVNETWLPGGEVTMGLDPERTDGRLVVGRIFLDGQAIGPVTMTWSGGQMQAMESTADLSTLGTYIDPADPMSQRLTGLKFGTNPDVADPRVQPLMGAGMFSFSMGDNRALGGDIDLPFMIFLTLAGATIHVDDRIVVQDGVLQL
jgi:leucyl aminopeptidase (aminopeptidase T)